MYYVNIEQIEKHLRFISRIVTACEDLQHRWERGSLAFCFAQERAIHLAVETVTDIGSLLIDGFLMRDPGSYEDIIEILQGENVLPPSLAGKLLQAVKLRRPLVQEYTEFPREEIHPMIRDIPGMLRDFHEAVVGYLRTEIGYHR